MPRQWILITTYIIFISLVLAFVAITAKDAALEDERERRAGHSAGQ